MGGPPYVKPEEGNNDTNPAKEEAPEGSTGASQPPDEGELEPAAA